MIDKLQSISGDVNQLEDYLSANFQEVYDFFNNEKYLILLAERGKLEQYILFKIQVFRELDIRSKINLSFITLLLDVSERFGFLNAFQLLFDLLRDKDFDFGKRLRAASDYLIGINTSDDYLNRFEGIYSNLQKAFETEEDNIDRVLATLVNYYAQVIHNFGEFNHKVPNILKEKINQRRNAEANSFLHHPLIKTVLDIPIIPYVNAFEEIHRLLDSFLGRDIVRIFSTQKLLIETNTEYALLLSRNNSEFNAIRQLSVNLYHPVRNDNIFHSLQRGTKVLEEESQLLAYMHSYGNMHYHKLISAYEFLPVSFFKKTLRIIDWGCGQGMATMSYVDFINNKNIHQDIRHVTLIEPSAIALKRATLHVSKYTSGNNILTVNKDLDSLVIDDLVNSKPTTKLQLFSNILDIDLFSLGNLLKIIKKAYSGENYFVCVSPYVNDVKTSRIDLFVNSFSKLDDFELLASVNSKYGDWHNNWTRVIRVFRVIL